MSKEYDVFISYSHRADATIASNLERGLKSMGRRWNARRALEVFRDEASLSATPDLWQTLADRLDSSRYAVVLLSPEAAESHWVNQEIEHFLDNHDEEQLLLAVTAGTIEWDNQTGEWTDDSSAIPENLRGRLENEPCWVDLRWARDIDGLAVRDTRFRGAVATLAAPIHGMSKDELEGEDIRQHRRFVFFRRAAVASLVLLVFALGVASVMALNSASTARSALRDLEDANGSIEELEATEAELEAANAEAKASLEETLAREAEALLLAEEAERKAEEAADAQSEAERLQVEAEAARRQAEDDRAAADAIATDARASEVAARNAETTARDSAARALARENEANAAAADASARQQEADAAANAAEIVARDAEDARKKAEEAARTAQDLKQRADAAAAEAAKAEKAAIAAALSATLSNAAAEATDPALSSLLAVESYCAVNTCDGSAASLALTESDAATASPLTTGALTAGSLRDVLTMAQTLERHQGYLGNVPEWTGEVRDVSISADGSTVAVLGMNYETIVWNRLNGNTSTFADLAGSLGGTGFCDLCAEQRQVTGIELNHDGKRLALVTAELTSVSEGLAERLFVIDPWPAPSQPEGDGGRTEDEGGAADDARPDLLDSAVIRFSGVISRELSGLFPRSEISFSPQSDEDLSVTVEGHVFLRHKPLGPLGGTSSRTGAWQAEVVEVSNSSSAVALWDEDGRLLVADESALTRFELEVSPGSPGLPDLRPPDLVFERWSNSVGRPIGIVQYLGAFLIAFDDGTIGRREALPDGVTGSLWRLNELESAPDLELANLRRQVVDLTAIANGGTQSVLFGRSGDGSLYRIPTDQPRPRRLLQPDKPVAEFDASADGSVIVISTDARPELLAGSTVFPGGFSHDDDVSRSTAAGRLVGTREPFRWVAPDGEIQLSDVVAVAASSDGSTLVSAIDSQTIGIRAQPTLTTQRTVQLPDGLRVEPFQPSIAVSGDGSRIGVIAGDLGDRFAYQASSLQLLVYDRTGHPVRSAVPIPARCSGGGGLESRSLTMTSTAAVVQIDQRCGYADLNSQLFFVDFALGQARKLADLPTRSNDLGPPAVVAMSDHGEGSVHLLTAEQSVLRYPADKSSPVETVVDAGAADPVTAIEVSDDDERIVLTGHESGRVQMWLDGARAIDFQPHDGPVVEISMAVVNGVTKLATRDEGGTVVTRDLSPASLLGGLCTLAGRNLTEAEWQRAGGTGELPQNRCPGG